jgi:Na+-driven multidrug efflux pump
MSSCSALLLLAFASQWTSIFTNDEEVKHIVVFLLRILGFYFLADGVQVRTGDTVACRGYLISLLYGRQCALSGVVRGSGKQQCGG